MNEEKLKQLNEIYLEYKTLVENKGKREEILRNTKKANNFYWDYLSEIISGNFQGEELSNTIDIADDDLNFLNFGLFCHDDFAWVEEYIQEAEATPPKHTNKQICFFTEIIQRFYQKLLQVDIERNIRKEIFQLSKKSKELPKEVDNLFLKLRVVQEKTLSEFNKRDIHSVDLVYRKVILEYMQLESMSKTSGINSKEIRLKLVELKTTVNKLMNKRVRIIRESKNPEFLEKFYNTISALYAQIHENSLALQEKQKELKDTLDFRNGMDNYTRNNRMQDFINSVRISQRMCALHGGTTQASLKFSKKGSPVSKHTIADAIRWIETYDPKLFNNMLTERNGVPIFTVIPGSGNAIYDWQNNLIVTPLEPVKDVITTLSHGIVMYRNDIDLELYDREILNSFAELNENKEYKSIKKLKEKFVKDYILWLTRETKGYGGLEKEIKIWFEQNIAPNKNGVIYPVEYYNLTIKKASEMLESGKYNGDNFKDHYIKGLLLFHISKYQESLTEFEEALRKNPKLANCYYNIGVLYKKLGSKRYINFFQDYIKNAEQSWWSKKAMEHLQKR